MPLKLYADECVDQRIIAGLRRREIDILTAADEGLLGAPDEHHLARASELSRPIITADDDFLRLAHARREAGAAFPGVIFILPSTSVGDAVRGITLLASVLAAGDVENWIEWIQ
jgi:hypothetical protein